MKPAKPPIKVLVFGTRKFNDYAIVKQCLDERYGSYPLEGIVVISGCAPGTDRLGIRWAKERGSEVIRRKPAWTVNGVYNPLAGFERNTVMVAECDEATGFWDGKSHGTKDTIGKLEASGKIYEVIMIPIDREKPSIN
jgi:hypothetical protein